MVKKWRQAGAVMMSAVMVMGTLAGCGGSQTSTQTTEVPKSTEVPQASEGGTSSATEEKTGTKIANGDVTLTIYNLLPIGARAYYKDLNENPVVKKISEETGLKFEFIHPPEGDDGSFFQQLLASGEFPDLFEGSDFEQKYPGGVTGAMNDGILMDTTDLVEKYAVNFNRLCEERGGDKVQNKIRNDAGAITRFGTKWYAPINCDKVFNGLVVRQDWLEKYNLETPKTFDELTNVLRVFKENGVMYPIALPKFTEKNWNTSNPFANAFGCSVSDFDLDANGTVTYSRSKDGYKQMLEQLNSWAKEGLLDTDFINRKIEDTTKLFQNGSAGIAFMHAVSVGKSVIAGPALDPEFKVAGIPFPRVNADDELHFSAITRSINTQSWQVSTSCKNPEAAVKFVDYLMDLDNSLLTVWGFNADEHQIYTEEADGSKAFTDFMMKNPDGLDFQTQRALYTCEPFTIVFDEQMEAQQYDVEEIRQSWGAWLKNTDDAYRLPSYITLTAEETKEVASIKLKLSNYSDEMVYKFIFGEESLDDANWAKFEGNLKELGCERASEIYKAAYDRYLARG